MNFELYGINEEILNQLSYESKLGKSLKNTLRKFNKKELLNELLDVKEFYECTNLLTNDNNEIKNEEEFKEAFKNVLSSCKEI